MAYNITPFLKLTPLPPFVNESYTTTYGNIIAKVIPQV